MMYFGINLLLWIMVQIILYLMVSLTLEPRWKGFPLWAASLLGALFGAPFMYLKMRYVQKTPAGGLAYLAGVLILLIYIAVVFRDQLWKKVFLFFLYLVIPLVGEAMVLAVAGPAGVRFDPSYNTAGDVCLIFSSSVMILILTGLVLTTWNRAVSGKLLVRRFLVFVLFPFSQLLTLMFVNAGMEEHGFLENLISSAGMLIGLAADCFLLYFFVSQSRNEELDLRLREMEALRRVEEEHYRSIEQRREKMARIRHDINNQINAALRVSEVGNSPQARQMLEELRDSVEKTREYTYCSNPVVNAVMEEKASDCERLGITLDAGIMLEEDCGISPLHLCSAFANILDNAIRAAGQSTERYVQIRAGRRGDYLHIRVRNPAQRPEPRRESRKGQGLEILREIAGIYNGEFSAWWENGVYNTGLALMVEEPHRSGTPEWREK